MKQKPKSTKELRNKILIKSENLFPVVGIGASAGGLEAFKRLIKAIPENSGMAYVLVQHLDPKHESLLPELLQKVTPIPVKEITDDVKVLPNHIYIIPSNKMLVANDGVLELSQRPDKEKNIRNLPIDLFFTSLAAIHQSHAIGVVLSGTASDGTAGLKVIKEHGGITFAQDEESAAYDSMPKSAVLAGVVDFVLSPEKIPAKILEVLNHINNRTKDETEIQLEETIYKKILSLLRIRKGIDFTYYKQTTIQRRILRRMAMEINRNLAEYLVFLETNKAEQDILFQDLLIPVTSFFRDSQVFDILCSSVFPEIIQNKKGLDPIRVWVAGCSTGQEAYSIAICIYEFLSGLSKQYAGRNPQIFATDLSEIAITKARTGLYSKNELEGLSPERLQEFFTKTSNGYLLNKVIRDMCVFAVHNFLKDPPFGKIDLASCRNVLIYMEPYLQKKAMTMFHYALNPKGFLLLGKSETSGTLPDLFSLSAKNERLFIRKDVPAKFMHIANQRVEQTVNKDHSNITSEKMLTDFKKTADDIMLSKYTPAGVVVNDAMDIVHFRGNTSNYLEQAPGKPSHNVLQMAKNGLGFEIRNILHKAKKQNAVVIKKNIPLIINETQHLIALEAFPLPNIVEPHYLILFHENELVANNKMNGLVKIAAKKLKEDEKDLQIQQLEAEIAQNREDMRSITEDQEAVNEELQSANEELLSSSEELQSLNEELETSKEELQSTNEELTVLNQELNSLNEQVTEASHYSESIVDTIREPLLILDQHLRVKTANESFYNTFKVNAENTEGVLIYDLGDKQWNIPLLRVLLNEILPQNTSFKDFEITLDFPIIGERIMLLNAREIIREKTDEKLILLAFEDISESRRAQKLTDEKNENFRKLVKDLPAPVYSCDANGYINFYNHAAEKLWGRKPELGKDLYCAAYKIFDIHEKEIAIENCPMATAVKEQRTVKSIELIVERKDGKRAYVLVHPQAEFDINGNFTGAVNFIFDITDQILTRKKIEESETFNRTILENSPDCVKLLDSEGRLSYMNKNGQCLMEIEDFSLFENKFWWDLWEDENKDKIKEAVQIAKNGEKVQLQVYGKTTKGTQKWWDIILSPMQVLGGQEPLPQIISISRDITIQKNQQLKEKELLDRFQNLVLQAPVAVCVMRGENFVIEIINKPMADMWDRKQEDVLNKAAFDVLPELVEQGFKQLLDHVFTTGERFVAEELPINLNRNGTLENAFVKFIYEPLREADGTIVGVMAIAHEITEQVVGRKKMENQAILHENMLMTAPGLVCTIIGPTYIFDLVNDRYQQIFGDRELKGKAFLDALPEMKGQGFDKLLDKVYNTGIPYVGIDIPVMLSRNKNLELEMCYFNFSYQPMYNEYDKIYAILIFGYEVTEQVNARIRNMETRQIREAELEKEVQKRTIELRELNIALQKGNDEKEKRSQELVIANQKLEVESKEKAKKAKELVIANQKLEFESSEKERKAAELLVANIKLGYESKEKELRALELIEVNKALEFQNDEIEKKSAELTIANKELLAFTYISSHDLQEPLRKIQTFSSRIMDREYETLSVNGKDYFNRIHNAAKRMQTLIEDLLTYSHTNSTDRVFEDIDLELLIDEISKDLKETIIANKAVIRFSGDKMAKINHFQFRQVMYNLIGNALKFSKTDINSSITISGKIAAGRTFANSENSLFPTTLPKDKKYFQLIFSDNGIGFDPQYSTKIFDVFQRLHGKEEYAGTGIGLAIVKKIIENHKGAITATGKLNEGATFVIYIPM